MKFLSQYYNPVGEKEIILFLEGKGQMPKYPVWVTFDDGYKDNYKNAYPIFKKYKIPATFFVTTGFINKEAIPYEDYVQEAVRIIPLKEVRFNFNKKEYKFSLNTEEQKKNMIRNLLSIVGNNTSAKNSHVLELMNSLKISAKNIHDLFMNWDEIRELNKNGFSIGAHTVNHHILSSLSAQEALKEISVSKKEIEKNLGLTISSFAYPRGKKTDFDAGVCSPILQSCGFQLGVSTVGGYNNKPLNKDRFKLKRMGVGYGDSLEFFKIKVSTGSFWQL
ncbi:MAG: polysaccharide deacetylase family protein [Candidatus Brocadiaceae bacterium]|nr:polysaccharide deacetylase family protein [Candidatus Brocadiaceae bacterium]